MRSSCTRPTWDMQVHVTAGDSRTGYHDSVSVASDNFKKNASQTNPVETTAQCACKCPYWVTLNLQASFAESPHRCNFRSDKFLFIQLVKRICVVHIYDFKTFLFQAVIWHLDRMSHLRIYRCIWIISSFSCNCFLISWTTLLEIKKKITTKGRSITFSTIWQCIKMCKIDR